MSSLARLMEAIEFLAVMIISSALIETFLPLPQRSSTSATTLALEALIKRAEGNSLRNRSMVAVNTLHTDSNSGKILWRIPLNLVFGRSDEVRDGFSFSGNIPEVSDVLRNGELLNRILVDEDEPGDSKGVFLIGLGLTQRQLGKIRDQQRINDNGINLFGGQEGKKIDMVAACGFHSGHDSREVFTVRSNSLHQFRKAAFIHSSGQGKN